MSTQHILLTMTVLATADIAKHRYVGFDGKAAVAGKKALGITEIEAVKDEAASINTHGALLVQAGGVIAAGDEVEVGTDGKAIKKAAGIGCGFAIDPAAADGDLIRVRV